MRPTETAVTCSQACRVRADALAGQLATHAALTVKAQRLTGLTPGIYLLFALFLLSLGVIGALLTQSRVLASVAPILWLLSAFCILFAIAMASIWRRLRGRDGAAPQVKQ
ncbi:hypothetical protein [Caenimonas terrae]|uniref:hypothetical protein n=1 Tax=Caenimonas terrae TaxID=696074 RepID=UPI0036714D4A